MKNILHDSALFRLIENMLLFEYTRINLFQMLIHGLGISRPKNVHCGVQLIVSIIDVMKKQVSPLQPLLLEQLLLPQPLEETRKRQAPIGT